MWTPQVWCLLSRGRPEANAAKAEVQAGPQGTEAWERSPGGQKSVEEAL